MGKNDNANSDNSAKIMGSNPIIYYVLEASIRRCSNFLYGVGNFCFLMFSRRLKLFLKFFSRSAMNEGISGWENLKKFKNLIR